MKCGVRLYFPLIISSVILLGYISVKKAYTHFKIVNQARVEVDGLLSSKIQHEITEFTTHYITSTVGIFNKEHFIALLKHNFPYIAHVRVRLNAGNVCSVAIECADPIFLINDLFIMTDLTTLVYKDVFISEVANYLHVLTISECIDQSYVMSTLLKNTLRKLPTFLFDAYTIMIFNEHEIWLRDKQLDQFAILFSMYTMPNATVIDYCNRIKNSLAANNFFTKKTHKKMQWIADIRFKNQIIVHSQVGGARYG